MSTTRNLNKKFDDQCRDAMNDCTLILNDLSGIRNNAQKGHNQAQQLLAEMKAFRDQYPELRSDDTPVAVTGHAKSNKRS